MKSLRAAIMMAVGLITIASSVMSGDKLAEPIRSIYSKEGRFKEKIYISTANDKNVGETVIGLSVWEQAEFGETIIEEITAYYMENIDRYSVDINNYKIIGYNTSNTLSISACNIQRSVGTGDKEIVDKFIRLRRGIKDNIEDKELLLLWKDVVSPGKDLIINERNREGKELSQYWLLGKIKLEKHTFDIVKSKYGNRIEIKQIESINSRK